MKKNNSKHGYTLYELIVVAGIILLLTSIILSNLDASRRKGRDSKKVSELKELRNALELYRLDYGYPKTADNQTSVYRNNDTAQEMTDALNGLVEKKLIPAIPTPSRSSIPGDTYYYQTGNTNSIVPTCDDKGLGELPYIIYFTTELPQRLPVLKNGGQPVVPVSGVGGYGYCLTI